MVRVPAKTNLVFSTLKRYASEMRTISYETLAHQTELTAAGVGLQLGYIRDWCRRRGLPWLNMIAVQKHSRFPGENYLPSGVRFKDADDEMRFWRGLVLQVLAYDWIHVNFEE